MRSHAFTTQRHYALVGKRATDVLSPINARFLTVIFASIFCLIEFSHYMPLHDNDLAFFGETVISFFLLIYSSYVVSSWMGYYVDNAIDSWMPLSYLNFNRGDQLEIRKYHSKNRAYIVKSIPGCCLTACVSIFTKVVAALIMFYITKN